MARGEEDRSELESEYRSVETARPGISLRLRAAAPDITDCVDCDRLCGRPKALVAGELGCVRSFSPSVLAFCRGGSNFPNSSRNLRLRLSIVDALRPLVAVCGGDSAEWAGGDAAGLLSLVCREPVLGEVGAGLFTPSESALGCPLDLMALTSLERLRPFSGECECVFSLIESRRAGSSSSRSVLITLFSLVSSSLDSTTVSASDSLSLSSGSPFCSAGAFSLGWGEAALGAGGAAWPWVLRGLRGGSRDAFRSPLLVITHIWDRTR